MSWPTHRAKARRARQWAASRRKSRRAERRRQALKRGNTRAGERA